MVCAFSVFTHMEHEASYRNLVDALRVVRLGGRFVFSCSPLDLPAAQELFVAEATLPLAESWGPVCSLTTSRDLMDAISTLAAVARRSLVRRRPRHLRSGGSRAIGLHARAAS
jgi:hypothetical protein